MLEVKNLSAGYGGSAIKDCDVIRNINLKAERGESLCILGPNGSGKSTLLKSIARIIDYRGCVLMNGEDISAVSRKELAKKLALLSQSTQVFFPYTVYETVSLGRYAYSQGFLKNLSAEDREVIEDILKNTGHLGQQRLHDRRIERRRIAESFSCQNFSAKPRVDFT